MLTCFLRHLPIMLLPQLLQAPGSGLPFRYVFTPDVMLLCYMFFVHSALCICTALPGMLQELNSGVHGSVGLAGMQALKPFMAGLIVSDGEPAQRLPDAAGKPCWHWTRTPGTGHPFFDTMIATATTQNILVYIPLASQLALLLIIITSGSFPSFYIALGAPLSDSTWHFPLLFFFTWHLPGHRMCYHRQLLPCHCAYILQIYLLTCRCVPVAESACQRCCWLDAGTAQPVPVSVCAGSRMRLPDTAKHVHGELMLTLLAACSVPSASASSSGAIRPATSSSRGSSSNPQQPAAAAPGPHKHARLGGQFCNDDIQPKR